MRKSILVTVATMLALTFTKTTAQTWNIGYGNPLTDAVTATLRNDTLYIDGYGRTAFFYKPSKIPWRGSSFKTVVIGSDITYVGGAYNNQFVGKTILREQVVDYFKTPTDEIRINNKMNTKKKYPRFRVAANGGWGYRPTTMLGASSDFKKYMRKLNFGFHYDVELSYYYQRSLGVGLKYNEFLSGNESAPAVHRDGSTEKGDMSDNIRTKYVGTMFNYRGLNSKNTNSFLMGLGFGYVNYQHKGFFVDKPVNINKHSAGFYCSLGYDWGIYKGLALGIQVSGLIGLVGFFKYSEMYNMSFGNQHAAQRISRIDLSVGLRFNK